jgi:hypothetical protein
VVTGVLAALIAIGAMGATAPVAEAASIKVVIVVGPTGGKTGESKVSSVATGANVLIYLGHGNGWPSPYAPFSAYSKDGMGLNKAAGNGNSNTKYFGEYYMDRLTLAPNAVVILNRLCYASGNSEWGSANPTKSTAKKRVDNYGAGFLRSGAKAVFASGISSVGYVLRGLFTRSPGTTMSSIFWSDPAATGDYRIGFSSNRTPGATAKMDPYKPGRYYRSVIGWLGTTVGDWRSG